jgi:putative PIN family toxin of toxin-antitoxin system
MRSQGGRVRAVVDTNLFVSGLILKQGHPYQLVEALRQGGFLLVLSDVLLEEYRRVLSRQRFAQRYGLTPQEVRDFLTLLATAQKATPQRRLPVRVRDIKDNKVLATALGGKAGYLVTGDEDLLTLDGHPKLPNLRILTVRAFLELLQVI